MSLSAAQMLTSSGKSWTKGMIQISWSNLDGHHHMPQLKKDIWRWRRYILLDYGADPNAKENTGLTPLHHATQSGQDLMVQLLLELLGRSKCQRQAWLDTSTHCSSGESESSCGKAASRLGGLIEKAKNKSGNNTPLHDVGNEIAPVFSDMKVAYYPKQVKYDEDLKYLVPWLHALVVNYRPELTTRSLTECWDPIVPYHNQREYIWQVDEAGPKTNPLPTTI